MNIALDFKKWGISFSTGSDWFPFTRLGRESGWNWIDITLIRLGFECSPYKNSNEIFFALLGFHFYLTLYQNIEPRTEGGWVVFRNHDKEIE